MEVNKIIHLDLFSGIGGFALAVDAIWPVNEHIFCEIDEFCQQVLKKHWPNSKIYGDIRKLKRGQDFSGSGCDILTGGFPCQPFSQAGKRKGTNDDRFLWPEMLRVIKEFNPRWVIAENVRGILTIEGGVVFEQVCVDLETAGYEVQPFIIPAVAVNAPHRRDRVWFVAHRTSERERGGASQECGIQKRKLEPDECQRSEVRSESERCASQSTIGNTQGARQQGGAKRQRQTQYGRTSSASNQSWNRNWLEVATELCGVANGLPAKLDGFKLSKAGHRTERLKALGNAIVPQVAIKIMEAIKNNF